MKPAPFRLRRLAAILLLICCALTVAAQADMLQARRNVLPQGYDFWVYTPEGYESGADTLPVILFLHGASLCGHDLNRVRRYGPIHAVQKGYPIPALIIAPQNPGGAWNPKKVNDVLDWTLCHYKADTTRIYVLGMSLGGYGTLDYCGTYPQRVAAAMALCGGCTLKDMQPLGELPLWILHGTADAAVGIGESRRVVQALQKQGNDSRLRFDWLQGQSHSALCRIFYLEKTYAWLFSHSLADVGRMPDRIITITNADLRRAYRSDVRRAQPLLVR